MDSEEKYQRVNLRIPKELHARVMEAAGERSHSMNAEIVQRLEVSLSGRPIVDVPESEGLNADERSLVRAMRSMDDDERAALVSLARMLSSREARRAM